MHSLVNYFSAVLAASSSSKATTSGSAYGSLIFILLIGVLAYVFFLRPRSQQARRQRDTLQQVSTGDEILTGAGIFGRVLDVESDRITIETAPGTRLTILRSTIARIFTEHPPDDEAWSEHDDAAFDDTASDTRDEDEEDEEDVESHGDGAHDAENAEDEEAAGAEHGTHAAEADAHDEASASGETEAS